MQETPLECLVGASPIRRVQSMQSRGHRMAITSPCVVVGKANQPVSICTSSTACHGLEFGKKPLQHLVTPPIFLMIAAKSLQEWVTIKQTEQPCGCLIQIRACKSTHSTHQDQVAAAVQGAAMVVESITGLRGAQTASTS